MFKHRPLRLAYWIFKFAYSRPTCLLFTNLPTKKYFTL